MSNSPLRSSLSLTRVMLACFAAAAFAACAQSTPLGGETGTGGTSETGGTTGTGGNVTGGTTGTGGTGTGGSKGGTTGTGGTATGGVLGTGGAKGGTTGTGGMGTGGTGTGGTGTGGTETGGTTGTGGAKGGTTGTGGTGTGGLAGTGGVIGTGGAKGGATGTGGTGTGGAKGGTTGTGGTTATGGTSGGTDPCSVTTLPSGGTQHTSSNASGTAGSLSWTIWSNGSAGSITTFSTPAFVANWNNSGDYLARIGLQWGSGKSVSSLGTVGADFSETKSGSAGGYSYIGIYGWSVNPCVEWYIVDDSYGNLPFNPGGSQIGTLSVDGGTYNIIQRNTTGTGGNRCGNVSSWNQIYSMRTTKRSCGHISISDHWAAWASHNQTLGNQLEASILVEAGGGSGSVQFPLANVTAQ
jgi:endo-1,4-beta-xylanase